MNTTVDIKIKPYLKEFIVCYCNTNPAKVGLRDPFGLILKPLLEKPPEALPERDPNETYVRIELPQYDDKDISAQNYISPKNQRFFASFVHVYFKDIFVHYVFDRTKICNKKDSIYQFCVDYGLTMDHINYELLKKKYDRALKDMTNIQKKHNKNTQKVSRSLSRLLTLKMILI